MAVRLLPVVFITEFIIFDVFIIPIALFAFEMTVGFNGQAPGLEAPYKAKKWFKLKLIII